MIFIFWCLLITSPVLYCADYEHLAHLLSRCVEQWQQLRPSSVMTNPEFVNASDLSKRPIVLEVYHEPLGTQEDLLQDILGKHHKVLLSGQVEDFQALVHDSLIKEEGYYKLECLWDKLSISFEAHYDQHQELYRENVPWADNASAILQVINEGIDEDPGLPFLLKNDLFLKDTYVRMLRKAKTLSVLTAVLDMDKLTLIRVDQIYSIFDECKQSFADSSASAKCFCKKFAESILINNSTGTFQLERSNHIFNYTCSRLMIDCDWVVRESKYGLFEVVQWLVSVMHGNCLQGLPALQKGFSDARYHGGRANGFYEFLNHDIGHSDKFMKFCLMWNKTFSGEKYLLQYLFEGMWERVQCFATAGKRTKVLEVLVVYFYWLHEHAQLYLKPTGHEWVQSFNRITVSLADPTYIDLVSRIAQKRLDANSTKQKLSHWYSEHIMPVLSKIVETKGYHYYGHVEGTKVQKEWGFNGYNISAQVCHQMIMAIFKRLPSQYQDKLEKAAHRQLRSGAQRYNCVIWPSPYIESSVVSGDLLLLPSAESVKSISLGHIELMQQQ